MEKNEHGQPNKYIPSCFTRILDYLSCAREGKLKDVFTPVGNFEGDQLVDNESDESRPLYYEISDDESGKIPNDNKDDNGRFGEKKVEQMSVPTNNDSGGALVDNQACKSHSDEEHSDEEHSDEERPLKLGALRTIGVKSPYVNKASNEDSGGLSTFFCRSAAQTGNDDGMYTEPELEAIATEGGQDKIAMASVACKT